MFSSSYFPLVCAALASSLITFNAQAMPSSSKGSQLVAPDLMLVAAACPAGLYPASAAPSLRQGVHLRSGIYLAPAASSLRQSLIAIVARRLAD